MPKIRQRPIPVGLAGEHYRCELCGHEITRDPAETDEEWLDRSEEWINRHHHEVPAEAKA